MPFASDYREGEVSAMAEPEKYERPKQARDRVTGRSAAAARMQQQHLWVDLQIKQAIERGEFDDLPGQGKPIENLTGHDDPEWWVKQLVEREKIAVLPPSLQLRKDDAELDDRLDRMGAEREVREAVEEFNARVMRARYSPAEGPPLITMPRDVEETVAAWVERRRRSRERAEPGRSEAEPRRGSFWRTAGSVAERSGDTLGPNEQRRRRRRTTSSAATVPERRRRRWWRRDRGVSQ